MYKSMSKTHITRITAIDLTFVLYWKFIALSGGARVVNVKCTNAGALLSYEEIQIAISNSQNI